MKDRDCTKFLQENLGRLKLRWPGFRRVRGQVCKRLARRLRELQLTDLESYREYLKSNPPEWLALDGMCRITISRFYRDRRVFDRIREEILPTLARRIQAVAGKELRILSLGCCSGEEPYSVKIIWQLYVRPGLPDDAPGLKIIGTCTEAGLLARARQACYPPSSLKDLPPEALRQAFVKRRRDYCLKPEFKGDVAFMVQDVRNQLPDGPFDLVLCRNLVLTYFTEELQVTILKRIADKLAAHGRLVIGAHEEMPGQFCGFERLAGQRCILKKTAG